MLIIDLLYIPEKDTAASDFERLIKIPDVPHHKFNGQNLFPISCDTCM